MCLLACKHNYTIHVLQSHSDKSLQESRGVGVSAGDVNAIFPQLSSSLPFFSFSFRCAHKCCLSFAHAHASHRHLLFIVIHTCTEYMVKSGGLSESTSHARPHSASSRPKRKKFAFK